MFVCLCVCVAELTSCSGMAVGVEAELSAMKRSQVEVTKILPDWTKRGHRSDQQREFIV